MNYIISILSIVFLSACSVKNYVPNKLDRSAFKSTEEKFLDMDKLECKNLENKKIFTKYTTSQHGVYQELIDYNQEPIAIKYDGDYAVDFKSFMDNILTKYCHSQIVTTKENADVVLSGNIKKYFIHDTKYDVTEDGHNVNRATKAILEIDTKINNIEFEFGHVLEAKENRSAIGPDLLVENVLQYNDYSSPFAVMAYTLHLSAFGGEIAGIVKLYDVDGNEIKKINLNEDDIGLVIKNEKQDILELYETAGYLKLLMYRHIKDLVSFTAKNDLI